MSKKITKGLISLGLLALSLYILSQGEIAKGGAMLMLAVMGMYWVEYREAMRYMDAILKRIFVCVDFEAAEALAHHLSEQMLFGKITAEITSATRALTHFYKGEFYEVSGQRDAYNLKRLKRWAAYAQLHAKLELNQATPEDLSAVEAISKQATEPLELEHVKLLMALSTQPNSDTLNLLRGEMTCNLHTAELCHLLAMTANSPARQKYYLKSAHNLAPDSFWSQVVEEV